ncbi:hypothetical protein RFI_19666, partial [Reticulomyxa filosa]
TWINLPDNKINIHGQWSTMYQWKRKNDGNVLVINGVNSVLGFHKLVSKFDMHKQEWFKLPDTHYCHFRGCNVSEVNIHGCLQVMSYDVNAELRNKPQKGIVEAFDIRDPQGWHVLKEQSDILNLLLSSNSSMDENGTLCFLFA